MSVPETHLDILAQTIVTSASWERMSLFLPLLRLLAHGDPVSKAQLAAVLGRFEEEVIEALRQFEEIVSDEEGRIVGAGISLLPTPYRFEVQGYLLYTWCALDTLLFPAWLEQTAQVVSSCPATGTAISLTVSPERVEHLDPTSVVLSLLIPKGCATCCHIRDTFCAYSQFFASREAASVWHTQHPDGHVLSIEEASRLAQTLARLTLQQIQEE
jgi:alkylmercury lyase